MSDIESLESNAASVGAKPPATPKSLQMQQPRELPTPAFIPTAQTIARTPAPEADPDAEQPGFFDAFNAAKGETPTMLAYMQAQRSGYDFDPKFELTDKMIDDRAEGIDLDLIPLYASAVSEDQLDMMYAQNLARMDRRRTLQNAGFASVPASILAEFTDLIGLLVSAVSGGGAIAANATRGVRAASAVRAGFIGASASGGLGMYRASQNPAYTATDIITDAASGGLFGVGVNAASKAGLTGRALAGGAGSAAPVVAIGSFRDDQDANDVTIGAGAAFLSGAFGGAMSKPTRAALEPLMWRLTKDVHASELDPATLTPKGRDYFAEQHNAERINARADASLRAVAPDVIEQQAAIDTIAANGVQSAADLAENARMAEAVKEILSPAPKKSTKGVFTKADIESRLLRMYDEQANQIGPEAYDIAGQGFGVEELAHEFGSEEAAAAAKRGLLDLTKLDKRSDQYKEALEAARSSAAASPDPQMQFLAALHENLPKGRQPAKEPFTPAEIETGAEFTINGEKFRVESAPDGSHRILTDGGTIPDVPLEALDVVPVDKGSMTLDPEMAAMSDTTDYSVPRDEFGNAIATDPPTEIPTVRSAETESPSLWREMATDEAISILDRNTYSNSPHGIPDFYFATSRDLAKGQGKNAGGIVVELAPSGLDVLVPSSTKPGMDFVEASGGGGERIVRSQPSQMRDNVRSVFIPDGLPKSGIGVRLKNLLSRNEVDKWTSEKVDGGTLFTRKPAIQRDLLGQPLIEPATGTQGEMIFGTEGATSSTAARTGDATDAKIAAQYDPNATNKLFSVGAATEAEIARASPYGDRYDIDLQAEDFRTASIATDSRRQGLHLNDMGSMVSNSEVSTIRKIGNMIFGDYLPKQDGKTFYTGDYFTADRQRAIMGPYIRVVESAYREMRAAGFEGSDEELGRTVFRAVVSGIPKDTPEAIARVARKTADDFGTLLEVMQRHGVRGALDVPHDATYMPHSWMRDMLDRKVAQHGEEQLTTFLSRSIAPEYPELTPAQHRAIAGSIIKNADKPRKSQFIAADAFDGLSESMREAGVDAKMIADIQARMETRLASKSDRGKLARMQQTSDPAERAALKASLEKSASDTGNPSNLKHRIQLDETYEEVMPDGTTLSVMDLLETDPRALMNTYSKRAYGNSVLAQVLKHSENPNAPIMPVVSIDDLLNRLRNEAQLAGRADLEEGNILRIEAGLKNIAGIPIEDLSSPTKQRMVRAINASKQLMAAKFLSGIATGIQNVTEPLSAIPVLGMKAVYRAFPAIAEMRKAALDGTLTNHDLALAEHLTGAGGDPTMNRIPRRAAGGSLTRTDRVLSYLEPKVQKAGQIGSVASGMQLGNEFGEKLLAASQIRRWGQWAESGKRPPEWATKTTTLSPEMVDRVLAQIKQHATNDVSPATGIRQKNLNWFDWTDTEAASAFRDSIALEGRRLFLRGNKNELQKWMGSSVGSMLIQFRGFPFQAFRAKIAYGLATKDVLHGASLLTGSGLAAAGYILTSYAKSRLLPPEERKKYLEDNLSTKAIGLATISKSSWSSMLSPAVDATATTLGFDPVFSFARTSGIQGKARLGADSFPVGAQITDTVNMTKSLVQPWVSSDYSFSQQDLRNIQRALLPRVIQQTQFLDIMGRAAGLPEKSKD